MVRAIGMTTSNDPFTKLLGLRVFFCVGSVLAPIDITDNRNIRAGVEVNAYPFGKLNTDGGIMLHFHHEEIPYFVLPHLICIFHSINDRFDAPRTHEHSAFNAVFRN